MIIPTSSWIVIILIVPVNYFLTASSTLNPHCVFQWLGANIFPNTEGNIGTRHSWWRNVFRWQFLQLDARFFFSTCPLLGAFRYFSQCLCEVWKARVARRKSQLKRLRQRPEALAGSFEMEYTFKMTYLWLQAIRQSSFSWDLTDLNAVDYCFNHTVRDHTPHCYMHYMKLMLTSHQNHYLSFGLTASPSQLFCIWPTPT